MLILAQAAQMLFSPSRSTDVIMLLAVLPLEKECRAAGGSRVEVFHARVAIPGPPKTSYNLTLQCNKGRIYSAGNIIVQSSELDTRAEKPRSWAPSVPSKHAGEGQAV